jgi:hypothetical protein
LLLWPQTPSEARRGHDFFAGFAFSFLAFRGQNFFEAEGVARTRDVDRRNLLAQCLLAQRLRRFVGAVTVHSLSSVLPRLSFASGRESGFFRLRHGCGLSSFPRLIPCLAQKPIKLLAAEQHVPPVPTWMQQASSNPTI